MAGRKAKTGLGSHSGGPRTGINNGTVPYNASGSNVIAEAKKRKRGGRTLAEVEKEEHKIIGDMARKRMDKRARGGRASATSSPFSSAGGGGATKNPYSSAARGR